MSDGLQQFGKAQRVSVNKIALKNQHFCPAELYVLILGARLSVFSLTQKETKYP